MPLRTTPRFIDATNRPNCPRFQFGLKTLLWVVTVCAVGIGVCGSIAPQLALAFFLGFPQMVLWGFPVMWLSLRSIRSFGTSSSFARSILAVMWAGSLYVITVSDYAFGKQLINLFGTMRPRVPVGQLVVQMVEFEIVLLVDLLFAAVGTVLVASVLSVFAAFVLMPWGSRPLAFASFIGGGVGSLLPQLVVGVPQIASNPEAFFLYVVLPIVMGLIFPPSLLAWAARLKPISAEETGRTSESWRSDRSM